MESAKSLQQIVIEPKKGWQLVNGKELLAGRDLLYFLVWRDIKVVYKQTVLGFAWALVNPVFSMLIFSVVFGRLAKMPSDGVPYPVFAYAALLPWTYFAAAMTNSSQSLISNANMLTKVYFPRIIIPLTPVMAKLVDFGIAMLILAALMGWHKITPTWNIVFLPLLVLLMMVTAFGAGLWLSALAIQYRDIRHLVPLLSQILMYAAPVVWPASLIPEKYRLVYALYPMAGVIEGFRASLIATRPMPWDLIAIGSASALLMLIAGALYFRRVERIFADVA